MRKNSHNVGLNNNNTRLLAIFQENSGKLVPECLHSAFYWS